MAKCAQVEIQIHKVCPVNTEAVKVWAAAFGDSDAIAKWQQSWKVDDRKPLYGLTQKKAGMSTTEYTFKFSNKCSAVVLLSNSAGKAKFASGSCLKTDECVDHEEQVKGIAGANPVIKLLLSSVKVAPSQFKYVQSHSNRIL